MANLVETFIDKVKLPDKVELSHTDRQLLLRLSASVDELKKKKALTETQLKEAEDRLSSQIQQLFQEAANRPEPPEVHIDLTDLKSFISEQMDVQKDNTGKIQIDLADLKHFISEQADTQKNDTSKFQIELTDLKHFISKQLDAQKSDTSKFQIELTDLKHFISEQLDAQKSDTSKFQIELTDLKHFISEQLDAQKDAADRFPIELTELKRFISEETEQEKYQIKACIEDKHNDTFAQLKSLKGSIKDEDILGKLPTLYNQLNDMEIMITRQMRTVKIMTGFTIWVCILTLAVAAAHVLGYI